MRLLVWCILLVAFPASAAPHAAIAIHGDEAFCDDPARSGVVNCETADGSPENPYLIEGWEIEDRDRGCSGSAIVAICGTTKHVILRDLVLRSDAFVRGVEVDDASVTLDGIRVHTFSGAALLVTGGNVSVRGGLLETHNAARAVHVEGPSNLTVLGAEITGVGTQQLVYLASPALLQDVVVHGGLTSGVYVDRASLIVQGGRFYDNGVAGAGAYLLGSDAVDPPAADITAADATLHVRGVSFDSRESAIYAVGHVQGRIHENVFRASSLGYAVAVGNSALASCALQVSHNDLLDAAVGAVDGASCTLTANDNWWGDETGPRDHQVRPGAVVDTWLGRPAGDLPRLTVNLNGSALTWTAPGADRVVWLEASSPLPASGSMDTLELEGATVSLVACIQQDCGPVSKLAIPVSPAETKLALAASAAPIGWVAGSAALVLFGAVAIPVARHRGLAGTERRLARVVGKPDPNALDATLLAGAAHDMKAPLVNIIAMLQLAEENARDGRPTEELIRHAVRGGKRLHLLVGDLLEIARAGTNRPDIRMCVVRDVVRDVVDEIQLPLGVVVQCEGRPMPIRTDARRLARVVENLVVNAVRAAGPTGWVRVTWARHGQSWSLSVEDSGAGVPAMVRSQLWQPKSSAEGTGLGLAICHALVASLGGVIELEGNNRFTVNVPLHPRRLAQEEP